MKRELRLIKNVAFIGIVVLTTILSIISVVNSMPIVPAVIGIGLFNLPIVIVYTLRRKQLNEISNNI